MVTWKKPTSFFYEGDERAVLLLHAFTSTNRDVKKLANDLHAEGYTCLGPIYRGHGEEPAQFLKYDLADWWQDAVDGLHELYARGYSTVHVVGISMGGLFALRLAQLFDVASIVTMSVPNASAMHHLPNRLHRYVEKYLTMTGVTPAQIEKQMPLYEQQGAEMLQHLLELIDVVQQQAVTIHVPSRILYGTEDLPLYAQSANDLVSHIQSADKEVTHFQAGHLMTEGKERAQLFAYIAAFLNAQ